jgi:hypothetical protein
MPTGQALGGRVRTAIASIPDAEPCEHLRNLPGRRSPALPLDADPLLAAATRTNKTMPYDEGLPIASRNSSVPNAETVQPSPAPPYGGDQVRGFQYRRVLADGLPGQSLPGAQLAQGPRGAFVEAVQQAPPARVGRRPDVSSALSASWR